jgi:hypothetical protein
MQILHHADLASMAASGGLNLVRDNPSPDRFDVIIVDRHGWLSCC